MPTSVGPRIEILVSPKGETTTQVFGVEGGNCHALTAPYEALFGDVLSTSDTMEAYEDPHEIEIKTEQGDGS